MRKTSAALVLTLLTAAASPAVWAADSRRRDLGRLIAALDRPVAG